jgi:hypothetical protein
MNAMFAAGLFDSPWVVAAILIGSALVNWLAKRRQEKQAREQGQQSEGADPSPPSSTPPAEFNLEETLRRLMGEEPPPTPAPPAPPLIPHTANDELPTAQTRSEKEPHRPEWTRMNDTGGIKTTARQPAKQVPPALQPPIALVPVSVRPREASETEKQAARHFEQLNEQGRHPATVVSIKQHRPSPLGPRVTSRWRDARSVRRAFVASLVFAPPKSFEP